MKLSPKATAAKNFMAITTGFVLLFAASNCITSIQSIVNQNQSLGTISQSVTFACSILTALILPQLIRESLGFKLAFMLGEFLMLSYVAVQIYPSWFSFIPCKFSIYTFFFLTTI